MDEYSINVLKNNDALIRALSKYKAEVSKTTRLCLETIKSVNRAVNNLWQADVDTKKEDLFIKNLVDTMVIDPLFNSYPNDTKRHGNGHALKESRHRKVKQAKKNGDTVKGWRRRAPDRSLELLLNKGTSNHVFVCEVKTGHFSKHHPDLTKLGAMLKDILDYALEKGVTQEYAITGLLVERNSLHSLFDDYARLKAIPYDSSMLKAIIESIMLCQGLIDLSCRQLKAIDDQMRDEDKQNTVPTCSSPLHYANYYK